MRTQRVSEAIFLVSAVGQGYAAVGVAPFELATGGDSTASAESLDELMPKLLSLVDACPRSCEAITLKFKLADR